MDGGLFGRISYEYAIPTILTGMSLYRCRIIHPYQDRGISVRESARIQGFPDTFSFSNRSRKEKYHAIGNAVPPLLGRSIGFETMKAHNKKKLLDSSLTNSIEVIHDEDVVIPFSSDLYEENEDDEILEKKELDDSKIFDQEKEEEEDGDGGDGFIVLIDKKKK
eukprot:gene2658-3854_t